MDREPTGWWLVLEQVLEEHDGTVAGERCAVHDFAAIYIRLTGGPREQ